MAGVGRKPVVGTYRTPRTLHRSVNAVDVDVDGIVEVINTTVDQSPNEVTTGVNSTLHLFILLCGPSAATLQLYAEATDEVESATSSSSSSSSSGTACGTWVLCEEVNVTGAGLLWTHTPLPAGRYKVMVTALTGAGDVIIRESHSA